MRHVWAQYRFCYLGTLHFFSANFPLNVTPKDPKRACCMLMRLNVNHVVSNDRWLSIAILRPKTAYLFIYLFIYLFVCLFVCWLISVIQNVEKEWVRGWFTASVSPTRSRSTRMNCAIIRLDQSARRSASVKKFAQPCGMRHSGVRLENETQ